jgi:hypothetical protein
MSLLGVRVIQQNTAPTAHRITPEELHVSHSTGEPNACGDGKCLKQPAENLVCMAAAAVAAAVVAAAAAAAEMVC